MIILDKSLLSLLAFAAAFVHELGHIVTMLFIGTKVSEIEITFFGAEIRTHAVSQGIFASIVIFASGAVANILSAVIVYTLPSASFEALFFAGASLSLAVLNLLPIRTLDGGCILEAVLIPIIPQNAPLILDIISSLTLGALWLTAVYLLLIANGNLSLMLFCMYLFVTLFLRGDREE
ncbi:MAG: hypothetical protein IJY93_08780 [Clostridia bacterium]|nr:hypothetical protein [Clostridia bacterium]